MVCQGIAVAVAVTPSMGDMVGDSDIDLLEELCVSRGMLDIEVVDWVSGVDKPVSDGSVTPPIA